MKKVLTYIIATSMAIIGCEDYNPEIIESTLFGEGEIGQSPQPGTLYLLYPNGAESLVPGKQITIRWSTGDNVSRIELYLFKGSEEYLTIDGFESNDGEYNWVIPKNLPDGTDYRILIRDNSDESHFDFSDSFFSIKTQALSLLYPNGGELLEPNQILLIYWEGGADNNIVIELWTSSFIQTISGGTYNDGVYYWEIPQDIGKASNYRIKIWDINDPIKSDLSDGNFTIGFLPFSVIFPNSNSILEPGMTYPIIWKASIMYSYLELYLIQNNTFVSDIYPWGTNNDGLYESFELDTSLSLSSGYQVRFVDYNSPYDTLGLSQTFAIGNLSRGNNENYEPNDNAGEAHGPLVESTQYLAYISPTFDEDWYYFNLNRTKLIILYLIVPQSQDYELYLYDDSGTLVSSQTGSNNEVIYRYLDGGTYDVKVSGAGSDADGTNPYILLFFTQL